MIDFDRYITAPKIRKKEIKQFCKEVFEEEKQRFGERIDLKVVMRPGFCNGMLRKKAEGRFQIVINIYPALVKKDCSSAMVIFRLYTTILHEFEHLRLLVIFGSVENLNYSQTLAAFENIIDSHKSLSQKVKERFPKYSKPLRDNYLVSITELLCNLSAYHGAYEKLKSYLSEEECRAIALSQKSLEFLISSMEVRYLATREAINNFVSILSQVVEIVSKEKELLQSYPVLKALFNEKGQLRSIEDFCKLSENSQNDLYPSILLRLFIYAEEDSINGCSKGAFENEILEQLANAYIPRAIRYFKNSNIGEVFLPKSIIDDNNIMIAHNIDLLNRQMKRCSMRQVNGSIFPLK